MKKHWFVALSVVLALLSAFTSFGLPSIARDDAQQEELEKERRRQEQLAFFRKAVILPDKLIVANSTLYEIDRATGKVLSKYAMRSPLHSELVVVGGVTYFMTADDVMRAVGGGKELWKTQLPQGTYSSLNDPIKIVASGDYLCTWCPSIMSCINRSTGKVVWSCKTTNRIAGKIVVSGGKLYGPDLNNRVTAFDLATGKVIWKEKESFGDAGPMLIKDGALYASHGSDGIFCKLDLATGKTIWKNDTWDYEILWDPIMPLPGGQIAVVDRNGGLDIFNCNTGKCIKYVPADKQPMPTDPYKSIYSKVDVWMLDKNVFYAGGNGGGTGLGGYMSAFDPLTNKQKWLTPINENNIHVMIPSPSGNAVMYENQLIFPLEIGTVYSLNAANGKVLWKTQTGRHWQGYSPVLGPRVFRNHNRVCSFDAYGVTGMDADSGKKLWEINIKEYISSNPVQDGEHVYCQTAEGTLHALDISTGNVDWSFAADGAKKPEAIAVRESGHPPAEFPSTAWINAKKEKGWSRQKLMEQFCHHFKTELDGMKMDRARVQTILGKPEISREYAARREGLKWEITDCYQLSEKKGTFEIAYDGNNVVQSYHWSESPCIFSNYLGASGQPKITIETARKAADCNNIGEVEKLLGPPDRSNVNVRPSFPTPFRTSSYFWKLSADGRKVLWVRTSGHFDEDLSKRRVDAFCIILLSADCPVE